MLSGPGENAKAEVAIINETRISKFMLLDFGKV